MIGCNHFRTVQFICILAQHAIYKIRKFFKLLRYFYFNIAMSNNDNKSKIVIKNEIGKHDVLVYSLTTSYLIQERGNFLKK